ncbi:MAG TPA: phenylalanine--tRNA ligase subunit beta [Chitinophagaceae bacterium]
MGATLLQLYLQDYNSRHFMTISYNWLCDYLPEPVEPGKLSKILTSIGLEVESLERFESIKGGLSGLVIGQVLEVVPHPNADKLRLTRVDVGNTEPLQIVCGAANVAVGQKVVVAPAGTTIYPLGSEPVTMKVAKIRGIESHGMICAEDEIGAGESHAGIMVLPAHVETGTEAADYFKPYTDWIYEIGLTPNRMDAMSHLGVARDVCAYLSLHERKNYRAKTPYSNIKPDNRDLPIKVTVENIDACPRYAGVTISGVTVKESPQWLKERLMAIGQRPITNIVDITNYVLHETGQPLHAFDAAKIAGRHVVVKNLPEGTGFISLDEKERKLSAEDLMICDGDGNGMCIAGVFGGMNTGVSDTTTSIFLESACFAPGSIRRTSMRHGLRTDAATRFEKGVDISNTVNVLKRAAAMVREIAGGSISSEVTDIYPQPRQKVQVTLKNHYLKKLSGKNYHSDTVKKILESLDFEIVKESMDELRVAVPFSKPDISLPADIVEEIIRIDGLDNIEIPSSITITPAVDEMSVKESLRQKLAAYLAGIGFSEIVTNSITNSRYYPDTVQETAVKMINSLSAELDLMRPSMLETGLEVIAFNLNRRNNQLRFFEFGKTYHNNGTGKYVETEHLSIYMSGPGYADTWNAKSSEADYFQLKGIATAIPQLAGIQSPQFTPQEEPEVVEISAGKDRLGSIQKADRKKLQQFDIRQDVYFADFDFNALLEAAKRSMITYREIPKYPAVNRDLALVVDRNVQYRQIEAAVEKLKISRLQDLRLFDVFESDKLGRNKKSMAVSFTFMDAAKTMTDSEVDSMIGKLIQTFEKELGAEIRK